MTEVRENGFTADLPGTWEQAEESEQGTFVFLHPETGDTLTVALLSVKPVYALADHKRLLDDYQNHRVQFEKGEIPALEQSVPTSWQDGETIEGEWSGVDETAGRRLRHRVMFVGNVLADFCYAASELDEAAFDERAGEVLTAVGVDAG